MERLFVDSSAWFAFANRRDREHALVARSFQAFHGRLVTTNFIFDETVSLCRSRLGHTAAVAVGSILLDTDEVDLIRVPPADERAAWALFCERADKPYSYTDCVSFVVMRRLGIEVALALDADFVREGFRVMP